MDYITFLVINAFKLAMISQLVMFSLCVLSNLVSLTYVTVLPAMNLFNLILKLDINRWHNHYGGIITWLLVESKFTRKKLQLKYSQVMQEIFSALHLCAKQPKKHFITF